MAIENENEKRETVADIVAQIRAAAYIQNADTPKSVLRFADRIEAAWKHEREEAEADALSVGGVVEAARTAEKSSAVGNAAAMREALERVVEIADREWRSFRETPAMKEMRDVCTSALSAPARNCDVYKNKKDAEVAFISEECKRPCGNCTVNDKYGCALVHECGVDWLFAPAAERKGE